MKRYFVILFGGAVMLDKGLKYSFNTNFGGKTKQWRTEIHIKIGAKNKG